jgi:excisionase family DNA binding protein
VENVEKIYTVREVCDLLGSSRGTVIGWIKKGSLLAFKLPDGRLWRVSSTELLAFIETGEKEYIEDTDE